MPFNEKAIHDLLYEVGLETVVADPDPALFHIAQSDGLSDPYEVEFEFWLTLKVRAMRRIEHLHRLVKFGTFAGSRVKLPTNNTTPMELDLIGTHEEGLFILELKVKGPAERNAFSELLAYSNYVAGAFALSGRKDITNVLVAPLTAKITTQAYLFDLLINERDIIVYRPKFEDDDIATFSLELFIPDDATFRSFANHLLSHEAMSCAAVSFHDVPGWIESASPGGNPSDSTIQHLSAVASYAAQLMEADGLHGFCFMRKRWAERDSYYSNTLFVCSINPFVFAEPSRTSTLLNQLDEKERSSFTEIPRWGFAGRLCDVGQRVLHEAIGGPIDIELSTPLWHGIVSSSDEVVWTHNLGFRPTGLFRVAYVSYLDQLYQQVARGLDIDVPALRIEAISDWFRAWEFMEACGLSREPTRDGSDYELIEGADDWDENDWAEGEAADRECSPCNGTGNGIGINPYSGDRLRCGACGGSGRVP